MVEAGDTCPAAWGGHDHPGPRLAIRG